MPSFKKVGPRGGASQYQTFLSSPTVYDTRSPFGIDTYFFGQRTLNKLYTYKLAKFLGNERVRYPDETRNGMRYTAPPASRPKASCTSLLLFRVWSGTWQISRLVDWFLWPDQSRSLLFDSACNNADTQLKQTFTCGSAPIPFLNSFSCVSSSVIHLHFFVEHTGIPLEEG